MSSNTILKVLCIIPFVVILLCRPATAQNPDCIIDGIEEGDWETEKVITIVDIQTGVIFDKTTTNVKVIKDASQNSLSTSELYAQPTLSDSRFIITLTDLFANYEINEILDTYVMTVTFTCSRLERTLAINFKITDTNNYPPEFLPGDYFDYQIFTPMPQGVNVSTLYGVIKVRDYDLTNTAIDFGTSSNDYLEMIYDSVDSTQKVHTGILMTKNAILELKEPLILEIRATEVDRTENVPTTSRATATLTSNPATQLPTTPRFNQIYYKATIASGELTFADTIEITEGFDKDVNITLSDGEYFTVTNNKNIVKISIDGTIPDEVLENTNHFIFSLIAEKKSTPGASATIYISISKDEATLKFEKSTYKGLYDDGLNIENIVLEGYHSKITFSLSGDSIDYFDKVIAEDIIQIILKEPLPGDLIEETSRFVLLLEAYSTKDYASATIIIELPKKDATILTFENKYYEANYLEDNTLNISQIKLTEEISSVYFTLSGDTKDHFTATGDGSTVTITVKDSLTEEILALNSYIVLVLEATAEKAVSGHTVINIDLPEKVPQTILKFENPYYEANYLEDETLNISPIKLTEDFTIVEFTLSGDTKDFFTATGDGSNVIITVKERLTDEILDSYSYIVLGLVAKVDGAIDGQTIVNIELPKKKDATILTFENMYYEANYLEDNTLSISQIKLTEEISSVYFTLSGDTKDHFTATGDGSTVTITVKDSLTEEILALNSYIVLVLEATAEKAVSGHTVINIDLPEKDKLLKVLTFENPFYEVTYMENHTLTVPPIKLTEDFTSADYILSGVTKDYFTATGDGGAVSIVLKDRLSEDILTLNTYIVLVLEAKAGNAVNGTTIINVKLPTKGEISQKMLIFEEPYYNTTYSANHELITPVIKLTEEYPSMKFTLLGGTKDFFALTNHGSTVEINVMNHLPADLLNANSYIFLILKAETDGAVSGQTIINVKLPEYDETTEKKLVFEKSYYEMTYSKDHELTTPIIKLTEEYTSVKFTLLGDTKDFFTATGDGSTVSIIVKDILTDEILASHTHIVLELEAEAENTIKGRTVINIQLPQKGEVSQNVLLFEEPYYDTIYSVSHELSTPVIKLTEEYLFVNFTLLGATKDFFALANHGSSVEINVKNHLPADVLNANSYIFLILEAEAGGAASGRTIINVKLPEKDSSITVKFEHIFYNGIYTYETSSLVLPNIILEEGYSTNIDYSLFGVNSQLFEIIKNGDKVTVIVKTDIPESILEETSIIVFSLEAKRPDAPSAVTVIAITLKGKAGKTPGNALTIIEIDEGTVYDTLNIGEPEEGCVYKDVIDSWPTDSPDWFYINSTTGKLSSKTVDREDPSVAFLHLSQNQLEISIECSAIDRQDEISQSLEKSYKDEDDRYWAFTKNINYSSRKKIVTIIINDINNKKPVFDMASPVTVGFPTQEIVWIIRPQSVITVHATDEDIGDNAKIKYTTESDHFSVHPETGVVYPKTSLFADFSDKVSLTVLATDGNGIGPHTVGLDVVVKPLEEKHIIIVTVKNAVIENVAEIISTLTEKTKSKVNVISSAVLPINQDPNNIKSLDRSINGLIFNRKSEKDLSGDDSSLSMFLYALDDKEEFLSASVIASQIAAGVDNGDISWVVEGLSLSDSPLLQLQRTTNNSGGLIIGVSILSVLLFITFAGICVYYFLVIRKKYTTLSDTSSNNDVAGESEEPEEDNKNTDIGYVNETTSRVDNTELASKLSDFVNPGYNTKDRLDRLNGDLEVNGSQFKGNSTHDTDEDEYGGPITKERRKSIVTFNEKVLQIDIDTSYEDERL